MTAPNFQHIMADLLQVYGDPVTVFDHQGYGSEDEFWQTDQEWEATGDEYTAMIEDAISSETLEQAGFQKDAEAAMWFDEDVCTTGDLVEHQGDSWVVIEVSNFHAQDEFQRQIVALRETNE